MTSDEDAVLQLTDPDSELARYEAEKHRNRVAGGKKAAAANLARNPNYYREMGAKGGRNGHTGGFYANRELASRVGKRGGRVSRKQVG